MFEIMRLTVLEDYFIVSAKDTFLGITGMIDSHIFYYWGSSEEAQDFLNRWLPKGKWATPSGCYSSEKMFDNQHFEIAWLTSEHIREQAKLGDKEALDCSIEHWKQIVVAGWDAVYKAHRQVSIYSDYCALCERFKLSSPYIGTKCSECPITTKVGISGCSYTPYENVKIAFEKRDKRAFESAAVEELNFLIELRNELYGNPYLETKEMSTIDERIAQCKKDRESINRNLKELEEQKEKENGHEMN